MLACIGDGLPDDLLVAEMHAIKHADGESDLAAAIAQFVSGVDDFHEAGFLPRMDTDAHG